MARRGEYCRAIFLLCEFSEREREREREREKERKREKEKTLSGLRST